MLIKRRKAPREHDIVFCEIKKLTPVAAFCELLEFEDWTGIVHISEISTRKIKDIKKAVKVGQRVFCKVLKTETPKKFAVLSIKKVNELERKNKKRYLDLLKRFVNIIKQYCENRKLSFEEFFEKYWRKYLEEEELVDLFLREIEEGGVISSILPREIAEDFSSFLKKSFKKKKKKLRYKIKVISFDGDGILKIRSFMKEIKDLLKSFNFSLSYQGAPFYFLIFEAENIKKLSREISKYLEEITNIGSKYGLEVEIEAM